MSAVRRLWGRVKRVVAWPFSPPVALLPATIVTFASGEALGYVVGATLLLWLQAASLYLAEKDVGYWRGRAGRGSES